MEKTKKIIVIFFATLMGLLGLVFCKINSSNSSIFAAYDYENLIYENYVEEDNNNSLENTELYYDSKFSNYPYLNELKYYQNDYYNVKEHYFLRSEYQDGYGLCWDFAGLKAIENFIFLNFEEYYNFSETWIAISKKMRLYSWSSIKYGAGGNSSDVNASINNNGVILDSDLPFEVGYNIGQDSVQQYFNFYQKYANTDIIKDFAFTTINISSYEYDTDDAKNARNYIKNYIWEYGAFFTLINFNNLCANQIEGDYKGTKYININDNTTNHAVIIIGYDENYECVYNGETTRGAWIAQNSHGESNKFFYIPYIDLPCRRNISLISKMTYNGYIFDFSISREQNKVNYKQNDGALYVKSSNANYHHYDNVILPNNVFMYDENLKNEITYKCNFNLDNSTVKIYFSQNDITNDFDIIITNDEINIKSKLEGLKHGTYKIIITDGDVEYLKCFVVFSGIDISYIRTYCNEIIKPIYDAFLIDESGKNHFSSYNNKYIYIYFDNFCLINSYKLGSNSNYRTISKYATDSTYAKGNIAVYFTNNSNEITTTTIYFKTVLGYEFELTFDIYPTNNNVIPTYVNYELNGGQINSDNYKMSSKSQNGTNDNLILLPNPTKRGFRFDGWYSDEGFTNKLPNYNKEYFLSNLDDMLYSGINYIYDEFDYTKDQYCKSVFIYAKFLNIDVLSEENYNIVTSIDNQHFVFDGQQKQIASIQITEKSTGYVLIKDVEYEVLYQNNINAGTAVMIISAVEPYFGVLQYTFQIQKAENNIEISLQDWTYGDTPSTPICIATSGTVYVLYSNSQNGEYSATMPIDAGRYYLKGYVNETQNYKSAETIIAFNIDKRTFDTSNLIFDSKSYVYDGSEKSLLIEGYMPDEINVEYQNNTKIEIGVYQVVANFVTSQNYYPLLPISAELIIKRPEIYAEDTEVGLKLKVKNINGIDENVTIRLTKVSNIPNTVIKLLDNRQYLYWYYKISLTDGEKTIQINNDYRLFVYIDEKTDYSLSTIINNNIEDINFEMGDGYCLVKTQGLNNILMIKEKFSAGSTSSTVLYIVIIVTIALIPAVILTVAIVNKKEKRNVFFD